MPMFATPNPRFKPMLTSQDMGQGNPQQVQQVLRAAPQAQTINGRTPAQIAKERQVAEAMIGQGLDFSPVQHWTQGAARLANQLAGMYDESRLAKEEEAGRAGFRTKLEGYQKSLGDPNVSAADRIAQELALIDDPWASEGARGFINAQIAKNNPQKTDDQREYDFARSQGFPGSFMDFQTQLRMAGAGFSPSGQQPGAYMPTPGGPKDPANMPIPSHVQKAEDEDIDAINASTSMNSTIDDITGRIDRGKLDLGLVTNWLNYGRNQLGASTPESVEYGTFQQAVQKMRNDVLMLHNGVQTEGDALRALQQIITSPNDAALVKANLAELKRLNSIALEQRRNKINLRRDRSKAAPIDPAMLGLPAEAPTSPPTGDATTGPQGGGAPQPGAIEDGMRFKGGNPADPNNWEPVAGGQGGPQFVPPDADPYGLQDLTRRRLENNARFRGTMQ